MRSTISRRCASVRLRIRTGAVLILLIAAALSAPAGVPAQARTGGGNVTLTLTCTGASCSGSWFWRQGGITGTLLGSGSIAGNAHSTTIETTTQPTAADTLNFGLHAGTTSGCGQGFIKYITPGSAINFTATVPSKTAGTYDYTCLGGGSTFNMQS
jgi:hypothetical protein